MSANDPTIQQSELDRLIGDFLERQDRGEKVDEDEFLALHPEYSEELRGFFRENARLNRVRVDGQSGIGSFVEDHPGVEIAGRYKLLELIGEGGMGSVWLAQQQQPVKRKVAIKLIRPGMDSKLVLARFEAERQALALMEHPNIAQVFDGGVTDHGRPYFVMEYIKGVPLTDYCDQARLSIRERMELFLPICRAIQHAHTKGVVHRDLKPSNIMVCLYDGRPVPKVIDFGLARALHQELTDRTLHTAHGVMVGTPVYMSPEQAELNNLDVDTRSDVYSLGVVLYELLTGMTPLDREHLRRAAVQEVLRLIREEEAVRPSTRLSGSQRLPTIAAQRNLNPAALQNILSGDLDWIVLKALEKERARRYDSTTSLARDIERFLADEAIEARPPRLTYRLQKLLRRHRRPVAAAGILAAGVLTAAAGLLWGWYETVTAEGQLSQTIEEIATQQAATQRAEASLEEQRRAAEHFLEQGTIRSIGLEELAGIHGPLSPADRAALDKWARIPDQGQRIRILEQAISDPATATQIARQFDAVLHASAGLSSSGRQRVLQLVRQKQLSEDSPGKVRAVSCMLAVALGDSEIHCLDDVNDMLPVTGWMRRKFELQLWYLLPRLSARSRQQALQFLTERATDPKSAANYLSIAEPQVLERAVSGSAEQLLKQLISQTELAWNTTVSRHNTLQRSCNSSALLAPVIKALPQQALGRNRTVLNELIKSCRFFAAEKYFKEPTNALQLAKTQEMLVYEYEGDESILISHQNPNVSNILSVSSEELETQIAGNTLLAHKALADRLGREDSILLANELLKQFAEGLSPYELGLTPWALQQLLPNLPQEELLKIRGQLIEISSTSSKGFVFQDVVSEMLAGTVVNEDAGEAELFLNELAADRDSGVLKRKLACTERMLLRWIPFMDQQQLQQCWELAMITFRDSTIDHSSLKLDCELLSTLIGRLDQAAFAAAAKDLSELVTEKDRSVSTSLPLLAAVAARVSEFTPEQHAAMRESLLVKLKQSANRKSEAVENFSECQHVAAAALAGLLKNADAAEAARMAQQIIEVLNIDNCPVEIAEIAATALNSLPAQVEGKVVLDIWQRALQRAEGISGVNGEIQWNIGQVYADAAILRAAVKQVTASEVPAVWSALIASLRPNSARQKQAGYEMYLRYLLAGPPLAELSRKVEAAAAGTRLLEILNMFEAMGDPSHAEISRTDRIAEQYRGAVDALAAKLSNEDAAQVAAKLSTDGRKIGLLLRTLTWQAILPRLTTEQVANCWDQLLIELPPPPAAPVAELNFDSLPLVLVSAQLGDEDAAARAKIIIREFTKAEDNGLQVHLLPSIPIVFSQVSSSEAEQLAGPFIKALRKYTSAIKYRTPKSSPTSSDSRMSPGPFLYTFSVSAAIEALAARLPAQARARFIDAAVEILFELPDAAFLKYPNIRLFSGEDVRRCVEVLARRDCPGPLRRRLLLQLDELASHEDLSRAASQEKALKPSENSADIIAVLIGFAHSSAQLDEAQNIKTSGLASPNRLQPANESRVFPFKHRIPSQLRTSFEAVEWISSKSEVRDVCR